MNKVKLFITIIVALIIILIAVYLYRHFVEFKNSEVHNLIKGEAAKWPGNEKSVEAVLSDGCKHILNSYTLTKQVRTVASATGSSKEKALVDAAVAEAYAHKYLA